MFSLRSLLLASVAGSSVVATHSDVYAQVSRTDTVVYRDDLSNWVLGQVESQSSTGVLPGSPGTSVQVSRTEFDAMSRPSKTYKFGKLQESVSYYADGTVATVTDARGYTTTLSEWKRGVPQRITFPDGTYKAARVEDDGTITWVRDETGAVTCYGYDAMGRVNLITYPSESTNAACGTDKWAATTVAYEVVGTSEYGIAASHWRRTEATGNARRVTYFDALWRPLVETEVDVADPTNTLRWSAKRYDEEGRGIFASYPRNPNQTGAVSWDSSVAGTWTTYDVLGRVVRGDQDSEFGRLSTTTVYGADATGPYTIVTNPRGDVTKAWYQTFDEPVYDKPVRVDAPEGQRTLLDRDALGRTRSMTRSASN